MPCPFLDKQWSMWWHCAEFHYTASYICLQHVYHCCEGVSSMILLFSLMPCSSKYAVASSIQAALCGVASIGHGFGISFRLSDRRCPICCRWPVQVRPGAAGRPGHGGASRWVSPGWWREGGVATWSWSSSNWSIAKSASQHAGYAHEPATLFVIPITYVWRATSTRKLCL